LKYLLTAFAIGLWASPALAELHATPALSPDTALKTLQEGNRRYVADTPLHPHQDKKLRSELVKGQHPIAAILSCADSRVPPELIFDEGLGDLFVVRVAGNVVDDAILGSLEYAAEHLHVPLIIVLGHSRCGAVQATINGGEPHTHIDTLCKAIKPAVVQARREKGDLLANAVRDNVALAVKQLQTSKPILQKLQREGRLRIAGAVYSLDSGTVEYLPH
jgi:carbonic anhydrase